ncbi:hypothetical protein DW322_07810 [Rhodococcus rhodnii]|uniref:Uncharacterized protein n=2 Tax=Rhodococcus rhodnii TaxID=38312 RepID=R7WKW9_9NOCA|nr:hypothetical protein [Rhodococcus rhodnii]EOM75942.1 hypothetical protein Rrhod_2696 [Rhodococcus rhodnii LMG 5362]TXG90144.1 hypothetical protein DW322_07810 [Rhodococcus rhodnii]
MATGVGLTIGDDTSVAVVDESGPPRVVTRQTVVWRAADGTVHLGDPAADAAESVRGFLSRVGEPEGIEYGGKDTRAEDLVATAAFCLFRDAVHGVTTPVSTVVTHPHGWSPDQVSSLRDALEYMGLADITLVPDEEALAAAHTAGAGDAAPPELTARGAAALAAGAVPFANAADADTEAIPTVSATPLTAYSAVIPANDPSPSAPNPATVDTGAQRASSRDKRGLLVGGALIGAVLVGGGLIAGAIAITGSGSSARDAIMQPESPTTTTTTTVAPPRPEPTYEAPAIVPEPVYTPPPTTVETTVAPPPPPPPPAPTTPPESSTPPPSETPSTTPEPTTPPEVTMPEITDPTSTETTPPESGETTDPAARGVAPAPANSVTSDTNSGR